MIKITLCSTRRFNFSSILSRRKGPIKLSIGTRILSTNTRGKKFAPCTSGGQRNALHEKALLMTKILRSHRCAGKRFLVPTADSWWTGTRINIPIMKGHSRSIGVWKRDGKKKTSRTSIVLLTSEDISGLKTAKQCTQADLSGLHPFQVGESRHFGRSTKAMSNPKNKGVASTLLTNNHYVQQPRHTISITKQDRNAKSKIKL